MDREGVNGGNGKGGGGSVDGRNREGGGWVKGMDGLKGLMSCNANGPKGYSAAKKQLFVLTIH